MIQAIPSGAKVSNDSEQADEWNAPRSIVARASKVSPYISELIKGNNVRIVINQRSVITLIDSCTL